MRKIFLAIAGLALLSSGGFATVAQGADHRDGPLATASPTADITDVYAFRSPENNNNLVVAIDVNPLIAPSDNATRGVFDPSVQYQVHANKSGGLTDDLTLNIRVTTNPNDLIIEGMGSPITAPITPPGATTPIVTTVGGVKVFAGLRDDPFFFDLAAFQAITASPYIPVNGLRAAGAGNPTDTFAGTNILAIVMEVPITAITGAANSNTGTLKTWVSTTKANQGRVDRMAIPAINTALITSDKKDAFNLASPINDVASFRSGASTHIADLRKAIDGAFGIAHQQDGGPLGTLTPDQVAAALIPDVVTIDLSKAVQFPNGRRLQDDVIDTELGVVLNRGGSRGIPDGINANDKAFGSTFPYEAEPWAAAVAAPAAPGAAAAAPSALPVIAPPNTGSGGLLQNSSAMWTLSGVFFAIAVAFGGAGALAAMRQRR